MKRKDELMDATRVREGGRGMNLDESLGLGNFQTHAIQKPIAYINIESLQFAILKISLVRKHTYMNSLSKDVW